jgi:hypothetical protein
VTEETRLECLRLAAQTSDDDWMVLRTAKRYEEYVLGLVTSPLSVGQNNPGMMAGTAQQAGHWHD